HGVVSAGQVFDRFGDLDGGGEVDGGVEDAGGVAGLDWAGGGLGKEAGEAGGLAGQDVHRGGVGADGGGVDPGNGRTGRSALDGIVVDQITGFEVVGGIEDEVGSREQRVDVCGDEVGHVRVDLDIGVEAGDLAAGGLGFG